MTQMMSSSQYNVTTFSSECSETPDPETTSICNTSSQQTSIKSLPPVDYFYFAIYQVSVPVLFGVITLTGVIGNSLVIHVILAKDRMRTVTNLLLLNLAIADLCFIVVIPTFTAYQFATAGWPFGSVMCKLLHYLVNVTAYVTVYTIVLVSFVR